METPRIRKKENLIKIHAINGDINDHEWLPCSCTFRAFMPQANSAFQRLLPVTTFVIHKKVLVQNNSQTRCLVLPSLALASQNTEKLFCSSAD
jgi:hypothetical protein